jgi:hypothetical protein
MFSRIFIISFRAASFFIKKAEDEEKWQEKILKLAEQEPKDLKPFERELVTYLISSVSGAEVFKNHDPCLLLCYHLYLMPIVYCI